MVVVKILLHSEKEKKTRQKHFKRTHLIIIIYGYYLRLLVVIRRTKLVHIKNPSIY